VSTYSFTTIDVPSAPFTRAFGINYGGQIVGWYDGALPGFNPHGILIGFQYSNGTYTTIADPNGFNGTGANGINNLGQIVGSLANGFFDLGYLYSGGSYTNVLHTGSAQGINDVGQIVGLDGSHGYLGDGANNYVDSIIHRLPGVLRLTASTTWDKLLAPTSTSPARTGFSIAAANTLRLMIHQQRRARLLQPASMLRAKSSATITITTA
jgi:uncharacterized membrane protein